MKYQLHHGDCLAILPTLEDCSVDAIVTDPPAGIAFMGKAWDRDKGGKTEWIDWMFEVALQCRRVIKPGGHALVWAIPRTSHWTGSAWEDAGWQVRDKIYHVFGSGFPKSLDVSKAIDKAAGAEREVVGDRKLTGKARILSGGNFNGEYKEHYRGSVHDYKEIYNITAPATPEAKQWAGWGTALKPAAEEWWLFRKPLIGTVAANVLQHGTGAINVDGCRVEANGDRLGGGRISTTTDGWDRPWKHNSESIEACMARGDEAVAKAERLGRWPANFTHDGSDEVMALFPQTTSGLIKSHHQQNGKTRGIYGQMDGIQTDRGFGDSGSAARFFYCAKASQDDRNSGDVPNTHATVKSQDLMTYLCRLITPPGGTILDPFTGSGSTGKAAIIEDFKFIGIEREAEYIEIAKARLDAAVKYRSEFLF